MRESEQRLRTILDSIADGIVTIDLDGAIVDGNQAAERMFGFSSGEMNGENISSLMPKGDAERHPDYLQARGRTGDHTIIAKERSIYALTREGQKFPVAIRVCETELDGQPAFIGTIQDMRKQEELTASLAQAKKLESIGRLAGGVAHDFNNLLMAITGFTREAQRCSVQGSENEKLLGEVLLAADKGASLTRQLMAFARKQVVSRVAVSVNELISGMASIVRTLLGNGIELEFDLAGENTSIMMDPSQFQQLVLNFTSNARDAMEGQGHFSIQTKNVVVRERPRDWIGPFEPGTHVLIRFTDDGCGMTPEVMAQAFEPFYTTKEIGTGTGFGLATCHGIVMQNAGSIRVESQVEQGTSFTLAFPTTKNAVTEAPLQQGPVEVSSGISILLVEDDELVRRATRGLLLSLGYRVVEAWNGIDALKRLDEHKGNFNIVMTDVLMPGMGGTELAKELAERWPEIRVLFVSGDTRESIDVGGILPSGVDFLQKPYSISQLQEKFAAMCGAVVESDE